MAKQKQARPEPPRHATLVIIDPQLIYRFNKQLAKAKSSARLRYSSRDCGGDQGLVWAEDVGGFFEAVEAAYELLTSVGEVKALSNPAHNKVIEDLAAALQLVDPR